MRVKEQVLKGEFELIFMSPVHIESIEVPGPGDVSVSSIPKNIMYLAVNEAHSVRKW